MRRKLTAEGEWEQTKALCTNIILISEGKSNVSNQGLWLSLHSGAGEWLPCLSITIKLLITSEPANSNMNVLKCIYFQLYRRKESFYMTFHVTSGVR